MTNRMASKRFALRALLFSVLLSALCSSPARAWTTDNVLYYDEEGGSISGHAFTRRDWWDQDSGSAGYDMWCECYITWQVDGVLTLLNGWRPSGYAGSPPPAYAYPQATIVIPPIDADESGTWRTESYHYATVYFYGNFNVVNIVDYWLGQRNATAYVPPPGCGGERDVMTNEYSPGVVYPAGVSPKPQCSEFEQHSAGHQYSTHFTWGEWNGGFADGNPHTEYGLIGSAVRDAVEAVRTIYGYPIYLSSGYRCPHGNASIPGASSTSHHMRGRAADLYRWGGQGSPHWSEEEFNELKAVAEGHWPPPDESFAYDTYSDRHYHVAW